MELMGTIVLFFAILDVDAPFSNNFAEIVLHLIPDFRSPHITAIVDGEEAALAITFVLSFQEPFQGSVHEISVKLGIIHGTKPEIDQHTPKPLSGSVADVGVIHNVFLATNSKGGHHLQNTARAIV